MRYWRDGTTGRRNDTCGESDASDDSNTENGLVWTTLKRGLLLASSELQLRNFDVNTLHT